MQTKADFQKLIQDSISKYQNIAPLYLAQDPRIIQHLDAIASVLSNFSQQIDVALTEPFEKVRDSTILADAAMRGIISKATPARAKIKLVNNNDVPFQVQNHRQIFDTTGYSWRIETPLTIPAKSTEYVEALQVTSETITHEVVGTYPFYAVNVPEIKGDNYLASISVSDNKGDFEFRERFVNTLPDERVFHVEVDDRKKMWVRFGYENVVAYQPKDGEVLELNLGYTAGDIKPKVGSSMSFDYLLTPFDNLVQINFDSIVVAGSNPPDISTLRDLCRYPSVYDHSAVYLGEFDFLIRRNFMDLRFLSVWNETIEEIARAASLDNINTLFVSVLSKDGNEIILDEGKTGRILKEHELTGLQKAIRNKILEADNSYRVRFFTPVREKIEAEIDAYVSTSYSNLTVKNQIVAALLESFGEGV